MSKRVFFPADVPWRANVARDIAKLRKEVAGEPSRRAFLLGAGALAVAVNEYIDLNRAYAAFLHGGGAVSSVQAITNARTGTTYQYLPQAIYTGALTGDTILIPAGTCAPAYPSTSYSDYRQTNSSALGFAGSGGSQTGNMFLGPRWTSGGTWSNASNAAYLTLQGVGTANNGRAAFSPPYATLTADYNPGDTVAFLNDVTNWPDPPHGGESFVAFGDGSAFIYHNFGYALNYSGIDRAHNKLTGITGANAPNIPIPAGTMVVIGPPNGKAIFVSFSPNPGNTFTNIEIWGAAGFDIHGSVGPIRQGFYGPGDTPVGSTTLNNCYLHDCMMGFGVGDGMLGDGVFAHFFGSEFYRMGIPNGFNHNIYLGAQSECIMDGSYTHFTMGVHLFKSRAATNFIRYTRNTGERTDANTGGNESCNFDLPNGGLLYVIGCPIEQSLNAANHAVQTSEEGNSGSEGNSLHPIQENYIIGNTIVGPGNGTGFNGGTGAGFGVGWAPITCWNFGINNPELPKMSSSVAGALPARRYFAANTVTANGQESNGSYLYGYFGDGAVVNELSIPAKSVAGVASPVARTGATGFNTYIGYSDPILYQNPDQSAPFSSGNTWFWDVAHTLPVFTKASAGSQPQRKIYVGITYQFPLGESVNLATLSYSLFGMGGFDGAYNAISPANFYTGSWFQIDANSRVTIKSPPSVPGAIGWNIYVTEYPTGSPNQIPPANGVVTPVSKQNTSGPIALGTDWTEPAGGFITNATGMPNLFRQNSSPQTIGTPWTEPTTGLVNHHATAGELVWQRRVGTVNGGACIDEWWAVAPTPGTYTITVWPAYWCHMNVSCVAIKGALSTTWPFASDLNAPAGAPNNVTPPTVTFTETNAVVVACFRALNGGSLGTAGAGYTQISSTGLLNTEYQKFTSSGTKSVTQTGGLTNDPWAADAVIIGSGGGVDATAATTSAAGANSVQITITTAQVNDILILHAVSDFVVNMAAVGQVWSPPLTQIVLGSPIVNVQNNAIANYYAGSPAGGVTKAGGGGIGVAATQGPIPSGYLTQNNNVQFNNYSGSESTFLTPLWASVIADETQSNYDYRPKSGGPLIGAGLGPGSSPEGQSLVPIYQLELFGSPTPGTPIPAKTPRPSTSGSFDAGAFEFGI